MSHRSLAFITSSASGALLGHHGASRAVSIIQFHQAEFTGMKRMRSEQRT